MFSLWVGLPQGEGGCEISQKVEERSFSKEIGARLHHQFFISKQNPFLGGGGSHTTGGNPVVSPIRLSVADRLEEGLVLGATQTPS